MELLRAADERRWICNAPPIGSPVHSKIWKLGGTSPPLWFLCQIVQTHVCICVVTGNLFSKLSFQTIFFLIFWKMLFWTILFGNCRSWQILFYKLFLSFPTIFFGKLCKFVDLGRFGQVVRVVVRELRLIRVVRIVRWYGWRR